MIERIYKWVSFVNAKRSHLVRYPSGAYTLCEYGIYDWRLSRKSKRHCANCEKELERLSKNPDLKITIV